MSRHSYEHWHQLRCAVDAECAEAVAGDAVWEVRRFALEADVAGRVAMPTALRLFAEFGVGRLAEWLDRRGYWCDCCGEMLAGPAVGVVGASELRCRACVEMEGAA